ncbi:NAD-dependent epimerase/dehydratase family protein [Listeria booriae]|uniref:NAD-dependent epimerase/dehydratase family protein n=1 Tax=Listeria booriae TaxID=1552123 RepID=UPI0016265CBF|nr:NAD-dependent epimerase/dehydratase family protein [Listeria booriae]MBC2172138.1 NAD-dependent epimerase/dehydratase family protein [Listeria booriae]
MSPTEKSKENTIPQCISPYAITKYASEKYLDIYANTYGFQYTVLRDATIFGSRHNHKTCGTDKYGLKQQQAKRKHLS